ncbi:hypothetical protein FIA58_012945 [Flavobacterium jejuense]|uniref:Uncharacterized protein n=1 Tax=Flavobacterium jejuense TaxID=1544455 RepID=A0ABX0IRW1_9FLAO|nr:hypothetical protein [Flavobacterium jejuense]NHN26585.1 hypothetical protein [Flavobacterium jejuense]
MKIELHEEKIVIKGKHLIEINYNEIESVDLKVGGNNRRKFVLLIYLILLFIVFSKIDLSIFSMSISILFLCILLFYKFDSIKGKAILFYKNKKFKMTLDTENFESTIKLIDILQLNKYRRLTNPNG